jgi:hypothetical protein
MAGEAIRTPRESPEQLLRSAVDEASVHPNAKEVAARYNKANAAEVIQEIIRITEEAVSRGSDVHAERQYLRTTLVECGVGFVTANLLTQALFEKNEPKKGWLWQLGDMFKNKGG